MYNAFDQCFLLKTAYTYTTKQSIIFFINSLSIFYFNFWRQDILLIHETYRLSLFSVLL